MQVEIWGDLPPERGVPESRTAADTDESGRGLAIIAQLSHACGAESRAAAALDAHLLASFAPPGTIHRPLP